MINKPNLINYKLLDIIKEDNKNYYDIFCIMIKNNIIYITLFIFFFFILIYRYRIIKEDRKKEYKKLQEYINYKKKRKLKKKLNKLNNENSILENNIDENIAKPYNFYSNYVKY